MLLALDPKSASQRRLNHLSSGVRSRAVSGLSYQSIDMAPALPVALTGRCRRRASPQRNTNGDADSFWFGYLSRHWSPCGPLWWWQMDCHLWIRGDGDTSPHISLSGYSLAPVCVSVCVPLLPLYATCAILIPSLALRAPGVYSTKRLLPKPLQIIYLNNAFWKYSKVSTQSHRENIFNHE